jgi:hypothetical protein
MKKPFKLYSSILTILLSLIFIGCSTDQDDNLKELNLEGKWNFTNINRYNYEGDLIKISNYDQLWVITKDSIKQFHSYDISGENMTGTANFTLEFAYRAYPDGTLFITQNRYKIETLNEDELIYTVRRPEFMQEFILYRVEEQD